MRFQLTSRSMTLDDLDRQGHPEVIDLGVNRKRVFTQRHVSSCDVPVAFTEGH